MSIASSQPPAVPQQQQALHPWNAYPLFHTNPAIAYLAHNKRWSISDINARPIDVVGLKYDGFIRGASPSMFDVSLMTLPDLNAFLPDAANAAYFADHTRDGGLIVMDIEKTCPPQIAEAILSWPCVYREISKSGRGYHAIIALPDNPELKAQLDAISVTALRAPGGVFEVLLSHWVTFTRNVVTVGDFKRLQSRAHAAGVVGAAVSAADVEGSADTAAALNEIDYTSIESTLLGLIAYRNATATTYNYSSVDSELVDQVQHLPHYNDIIDHLVSTECEYTLADYDDDHSRFEFALLSWLHNQFYAVANVHNVVDSYDLHAQAVVIYQAITERIDHRDKHDTTRSGMPYLLYSATRCVE